MNKDDLITFLKENLTIEVENHYEMYSDGEPKVKVKLLLDGEMISEDTAY